jgi:hypothetical protein
VKKRLVWAAPAVAAIALLAVSQPWASTRPLRDPRVPKLEQRVARLERLVAGLRAHEPELAVTTLAGAPATVAPGAETAVDSASCPVTTVVVGGAWSAAPGVTPVASYPNGQRWEVAFANGGGAPVTVTASALCARPS